MTEQVPLASETSLVSLPEVSLRKMLAAGRDMLGWASFETEYDGRTYEICKSCSGQEGLHRNGCKVEEYRALFAVSQ